MHWMVTADFVVSEALIFRAVRVFVAEIQLVELKPYKDLFIFSFKGVK